MSRIPYGHRIRGAVSNGARRQGSPLAVVLKSGEEHELLMLLKNDWHQNITVFSVSPSFRNPDNMEQVLRNVPFVRVMDPCNDPLVVCRLLSVASLSRSPQVGR